jgi:hypothetical protein
MLYLDPSRHEFFNLTRNRNRKKIFHFKFVGLSVNQQNAEFFASSLLQDRFDTDSTQAPPFFWSDAMLRSWQERKSALVSCVPFDWLGLCAAKGLR